MKNLKNRQKRTLYVSSILITMLGSFFLSTRQSESITSALSSKESLKGPDSSNIVPGQVIVKLKSNNNQAYQSSFSQMQSLQQKAEEFGIESIHQIFERGNIFTSDDSKYSDLSRIFQLTYDSSLDPWIVSQQFSQDENVEYAEPRFIYKTTFIPNDPLYPEQKHLSTIDAEQAWDISTGENVIIAIVDTDVHWQHPDLVSNIWQNLGEDADGDGHTIEYNGTYWELDSGDLNGIDDDDFDGNPESYIDDLIGWDSAMQDNEPAGIGYHGTHVAGIAAATTNNETGVASVAFNAKIMPVKANNELYGDGYVTHGYEGIAYAVDAGADIINCSWGGNGESRLGRDVLDYAAEMNVLVIAAAGNYNREGPIFPSRYPSVMCVAATDYFGNKSDYSNYGFEVDVAAPGDGIESSMPGNKYAFLSGTSMATPVVSGVAALVKSYYPNWSASKIRAQLQVGSDDSYGYFESVKNCGSGIINAKKALETNSPAIRSLDISISDEKGGNGNGIIEASETAEITFRLKNILEDASNITLTLMEDDIFVTIVEDQVILEKLDSDEIVDVTFEIQIAHRLPINRKSEFLLEIDANEGSYSEYSDWQGFYIEIEPNYRTHENGNVALTVSSAGVMGYYDYIKTNDFYGKGFQYPKGSASALFHGSVLVAMNEEHVSDACYGDAYHASNNWEVIPDYNIKIITDETGRQTTESSYNDLREGDQYGDNPIGVRIDQKSFSYASAPYDDFVVVEYDIENLNDVSIEGLYVGLYMDWDISDSGDDQVGFDQSHSLGYMYDHNSAHYGISVLTGEATSYRAVDNSESIWTTFWEEDKFKFMSEGFEVTESDRPYDWSHLLSTGPFDLEPNEKRKIAFAVLGGDNLEDLQFNSEKVKEVYESGGIAPRLKFWCESDVLDITQGGTDTVSCKVESINGFEGEASLTCDSSGIGIDCSFEPSQLTIAADNTYDTVLTVSAPESVQPASYNLELTALSKEVSYPTNLNINVKESSNQKPQVGITAPQDGETLSEIVTVAAEAKDPDGSISKVVFTLPDDSQVIDTDVPYSIEWDSELVEDGTDYQISALAYDNLGTPSDKVTISVNLSNASGCETNSYESIDIPKDIVDYGDLTSTLDISDQGTINHIDVSLKILHTWRGDLIVDLVSPNGTVLNLHNRKGSSKDNVIIENQVAEVFIGEEASGVWEIRIRDNGFNDIGTLESWDLTIEVCE